MYSTDKTDQHPDSGERKTLQEVNDNIRKAQDDESTEAPVDPKKTGNRPRFDRDR